MSTILLLLISNVFMTFAWYGHLRHRTLPLATVILVSWGIAFFEYCFQVPANRWGYGRFSAAELKTIQEVISLVVFAVFSVAYLNRLLKNSTSTFAHATEAVNWRNLKPGSLRMRGREAEQPVLFSYVNVETRVPREHPLRTIKALVDKVLKQLSPRFEAMYARRGRPSVPPEQLLRALLLQIFYTVRSERLLMEQLDYNLLFRWFVGLGIDDQVWVPETFSANRDRLMQGEVARAFFTAVVEEARSRDLLSDDHFTVDGTLLEAWASQKSFRPIDEPPGSKPGGRNPEVDFRGEKRSNATHRSTTDPDARLLKKSKTTTAKALLHGECADGEPQRADRGYRGRACDRHGGVRQRPGHAGAAAPAQATPHARGRQALRYEGFRARVPRAGCHAARGAEHHREPGQRDRRPHHAASGIQGESAQAQARRAGIRLGQDRGPAGQAASPGQEAGRLDLRLHLGGVQPGEAAHPDRGRSVPVNCLQAPESTQSRAEASENAAMEPARTSPVAFATPGLKRRAEHTPNFLAAC
jgi:uncharacterized protein (DUF486 family)/transposase